MKLRVQQPDQRSERFHRPPPAAALRGACLVLGLMLWGCAPQPGDAGTGPAPQNEDQANQTHTNRLADETSPYLLLHAHNPVNWYPWGPEAFRKAQREDKPIFLSIGYSSCYWCHVMERLVFSDKEIAQSMNEHFVNVKVDREERPDVDDVYMTALNVYFQLIGSPQGGGWPLSMFLTPEGKPFAGGTYFPPEDEGGRLGFPTVMRRVVDLWENQREELQTNADLITRQVQRVMKPQFSPKPVDLNHQLVLDAVGTLLESYDPEYGGLDFRPSSPNAPKFPVPAKLALLQYAVRRHGHDEARKALDHTLDEIAAGGIRDHLGGGFHRYSTDRRWHVPHFEKMLYDQAQLADVYVEAYRRTGKDLYRNAAESTFAFVLRKMTGVHGGFHSALGAETDGVEGKYYVWTPDEVQEVLGEGDARLFQHVYGMREPNSFEHGYVLHLPQPVDEAARELNRSPQDLQRRLAAMRQKMLQARTQRKEPLKDDKVLAGWNGLMIRSFAHAADVLGNERYLQAAEKAALFVLSTMRDDQGRLLRTYRDGQAQLNAYLDDYAFLIEGLLALYETTGDEKWLNAAHHLTNDQIDFFWDEQGKGFFFTSHHHEELIARTKNARDSVLPAGNSVSVRNLIRLASLTGEEKYRQYAKQIIDVFATNVEQMPSGTATLALAIGEFLDNPDFAAARPRP